MSEEEVENTDDIKLVISYLEGAYLQEELPKDYDEDNGGTSETDPKIDGEVKMIASIEEVKTIINSAEKWVAGILGFIEYSDITPTSSLIGEAKILYAAARLHCKKMKDSDQKKEVAYPTTCLKENELYQSALEILNKFIQEDEEKDDINQNIQGWI